jgi:hypothetical protein
MANLVPEQVPPGLDHPAGNGEQRTLHALQDALPDDYWIFHNCHWSRSNERFTDFGEIDFVIVNRSGDVLFIEQKNGPLAETDEGLVKEYQRGRQKNVARQILRSVGLVQNKFREQHPALELNPVYLVCCPDFSVTNLNSVGLERRHICDAQEYPHIARKVQDLIPLREGQHETRFRTIMDFFSDVCHMVPDIHAQLAGQRAYCLRHRGTLADWFANLDMSPFRLRVEGTAGCGKSLFACAMFEQRRRRGERVLLVCFNNRLGDQLRARLGPGGYVNTFHGLCREFLAARGAPPDFSRSDEPGFWNGMLERVTAETVPQNWLFDTVIVDEGQDFEPEWYEILRLFLREPGNVFWFEDPLQNLYDKPAVVLDGFITYRCRENFRSPRSIADYIRRTLDFEFTSRNPFPGTGVGVHPYAGADSQVEIVERLLRTLRKDGFAESDIAILTCQGLHRSVFGGMEEIGNIPLKTFTGDYDENSNQVYTDGTVTFDSIYRFKGNEAAVVILVDAGEQELPGERFDRIMFCGMTRATLRLDILCREETAQRWAG